jgi:hypothetical protein
MRLSGNCHWSFVLSCLTGFLNNFFFYITVIVYKPCPMCTKFSFSSKVRINKTVDLINHKIFLQISRVIIFITMWSHILSHCTKNTLFPSSFMTIHLGSATNNHLTGSLCQPENFLIIFLLIDSLLKCTVSTTYVLYHRTHFADIRTASLLSVFNVRTVFIIYLFRL